ncbi:MAG: CRISPR-associated endonuclease Cas6 [Chitinophagaceae bacterium]|nr:CRISPR-associated endonuclease Cas6 [Chitinophagaceae bacterium]
MSHTIHQTVIRFPEIQLATRDAHKLRGYFGLLFQAHSPLLHNHLESGEAAYRYPLVQYKVLNSVPTLVGLNEGADLLIRLFLNIKELQIGERIYRVYQKNIESKTVTIGLSNDLHTYQFQTLWMALNQQNYATYVKENQEQRTSHLKSILKGNLLSFFKAMDYYAKEQVMVNLKIANERETQFKNKTMLAFEADFVTNCSLPGLVGLGKSVARGFGSIQAV